MSIQPGDTYDVAVVGAGVTGCACAYRLAPDHDVAVVEKGQVAGEASGLSAGLISPSKFYPDHPDMAKYLNREFQEIDGTGEFELTERPRVGLIHEKVEAEARERAAFLSDHDLPVAFLEPDEVREQYPQLDVSGFVGAVEYADHGWVDPYTLTRTYLEEARDDGADVFRHTPVEDLLVGSGGVEGVATPDGEVRADHVVLASGWRTPHIVEEWIGLPIKPFMLQVVMLDPGFEDGWEAEYPIAHVEHEGVYCRPEHNGDLLVGDGFRAVEDPETASSGVDADEEFRQHVADLIPSVLAEMDDARIVDHWAGIEGMVPDVQPVVDAPDAVPDGVVIAQASTLGILSSPGISTAVRSLVTGEEAPFDVDPFAADRFEIRRPDWGREELPAYFEEEG